MWYAVINYYPIKFKSGELAVKKVLTCFDYFTVLLIRTVRTVTDPITLQQ